MPNESLSSESTLLCGGQFSLSGMYLVNLAVLVCFQAPVVVGGEQRVSTLCSSYWNRAFSCCAGEGACCVGEVWLDHALVITTHVGPHQ